MLHVSYKMTCDGGCGKDYIQPGIEMHVAGQVPNPALPYTGTPGGWVRFNDRIFCWDCFQKEIVRLSADGYLEAVVNAIKSAAPEIPELKLLRCNVVDWIEKYLCVAPGKPWKLNHFQKWLISQLTDDHKYVVIDAHRQCGKSVATGLIALTLALAEKSRIVVVTQPSMKDISMDWIRKTIRATDWLQDMVTGDYNSQTWFKNGSNIQYTSSTGGLRSAGADTLLVEEPGYLDSEFDRLLSTFVEESKQALLLGTGGVPGTNFRKLMDTECVAHFPKWYRAKYGIRKNPDMYWVASAVQHHYSNADWKEEWTLE